MAMATSGAVLIARSEVRTRTALLLEAIALRHQIAVLEPRRLCDKRGRFRGFAMSPRERCFELLTGASGRALTAEFLR